MSFGVQGLEAGTFKEIDRGYIQRFIGIGV